MGTIVRMVRGDTRPSLEFQFLKDDGTPQPITGATVRFRIRRKGATAVLITRICTNTDEANGKSRFDWQAADWNTGALDAAGTYEAEPEVTYADATVGTVYDLVTIVVREAVG